MFDCNACRFGKSQAEGWVEPEIRRLWHCGWIDESRWIGNWSCDRERLSTVPGRFGDTKYQEDVCPGFLMAQPLVAEVVTAWRAFDKGNWGEMYMKAPNVLREGVEYFAHVVEAYRSWFLKESERKRKQEEITHGDRR